MDALRGDVMKRNAHDEDNSTASKSEVGSGVGKKFALETAF